MTRANLTEIFQQHFSQPARLLASAPGRVNLLGEHVDYNDGIVLPAAIDRAVELAAAPVAEHTVSLYALDLGKQVEFSLDALDTRQDLQGQPLPSWAVYPAGVAWAIREAGLPVSGLQAVYTSDVPIGSGLSSSAAVEVAFASAWQRLDGWKMDQVKLAQICQRAEQAYVGVNCGLMDQFASACGVAGHALYFDTRSLEWYPLSLPMDTVIVVADSGVRRSLSTSAYNERRASCEEAVRLLQQYMPNMRSLRDISPVEFMAYCEFLPPVTHRRAEHVIKEIARVEQAVIALRQQETQMFGGLMYSGHASLRYLYEVSCPELDILVEATRTLPGCYGARLTGAGFGGCTVNLVAASQAEAFIRGLHDEYEIQTERDASIYLCKASAGAQARFL